MSASGISSGSGSEAAKCAASGSWNEYICCTVLFCLEGLDEWLNLSFASFLDDCCQLNL